MRTEIAQMAPFDFLVAVQRRLLNEAAMASAYDKWLDDYARTAIRGAWSDSPKHSAWGRKLSIVELRTLTEVDLRHLGFGDWDGDLTLIPLWAWNYVADGTEITSINDEVCVKGGEKDVDLDARFGCIAWGWRRAAPVGTAA